MGVSPKNEVWGRGDATASANFKSGFSCYSLQVLDPQTIELLRQLGVDPANVESLVFSAAALTVLTLVAAIPTGIIARRKRRSQTLWLLFALSIPFIPLLLVWLLPELPAEPKAKP